METNATIRYRDASVFFPTDEASGGHNTPAAPPWGFALEPTLSLRGPGDASDAAVPCF